MELFVFTMTILFGIKLAAKVGIAVKKEPVVISPAVNGWGILIQVGFLVWGAILLST